MTKLKEQEVFLKAKEDFEKGGIGYMLKKTNNQQQNPKYHSFNVGEHREKVEKAIQTIIKQDEEAKFLEGYGYKHDLFKGYTTTYKNNAPQELMHEKYCYEFLKLYGEENKYMLFCIKNHHRLSNLKVEGEVSVEGYGDMNKETNVEELTNLILSEVKKRELKTIEKGNEKLLKEATNEFRTKTEVVLVLKLLGYALLADALGGFKKEIAYPQFYKAQHLIRFTEQINQSKKLYFEEDKELFKEKVIQKIKETKKLNTPKEWEYDIEEIKKEAVTQIKYSDLLIGSDYEKLANLFLKRIAKKNKDL